MWLLPVFSPLARSALRLFYRLRTDGAAVPAAGPVLLVANHPNSLLDPAAVVAVARRPVRFLAKAPLFSDPLVGWLVKGAGSLPVYRKQDDPAQMDRNEDTFRAVYDALAAGAAVGIFPEGTSHSAPSLVPLKTGAARIALGAAEIAGRPIPVVPVGLSFREKETFRSEALLVTGEAVSWAGLEGAGPKDADAVRELTRRIDEALHDVTVNLERWEDAPLVDLAEEVWAAEREGDPSAASRVARLGEAAEAMASLRRERPGEYARLAREVRGHARVLRALGMRPAEVHDDARTRTAAGWTARHLAFFGLGTPVAAVGLVLFWVPYRLTGIVADLAKPERDVRATYKLLGGGLFHGLWIALLVGAAGWHGGWIPAVTALVALPLMGVVTLHVVERWGRAVGEARRFFLRRTRGDVVREVRERQREIAESLNAAWEGVRGGAGAAG